MFNVKGMKKAIKLFSSHTLPDNLHGTIKSYLIIGRENLLQFFMRMAQSFSILLCDDCKVHIFYKRAIGTALAVMMQSNPSTEREESENFTTLQLFFLFLSVALSLSLAMPMKEINWRRNVARCARALISLHALCF